jgi:phosphoribosyl 1,2-cyclic phosphodiesterase
MLLDVLASGSQANCALVRWKDTTVLVDAGLGWRETFERMDAIGAPPESVRGLLVSHSHSDHFGHARDVVKKLRCPVYMTPETAQAVEWTPRLGAITCISLGEPFNIGDLEVLAFPTMHDCPGSCGYSFSDGDDVLTIVTDLGEIQDEITDILTMSDTLMIESSYCEDVLKAGPYAPALKHRISSCTGHLSNQQLAEFIKKYKPDVHEIILAHISEIANTPELALASAQAALDEAGMSHVKVRTV